MVFKAGDIDNARLIMREAAEWLAAAGMPLWRPDDVSIKKLLHDNKEEDFIVGYENDEPVAAMILKWHDPELWPDVKPNESGFIHKLAVARAWAGKGKAAEMIRFAENECRKRGLTRLRLDCAADRPKLCAFYKARGFAKVDLRMVGEYDVAFYEKKT